MILIFLIGSIIGILVGVELERRLKISESELWKKAEQWVGLELVKMGHLLRNRTNSKGNGQSNEQQSGQQTQTTISSIR